MKCSNQWLQQQHLEHFGVSVFFFSKIKTQLLREKVKTACKPTVSFFHARGGSAKEVSSLPPRFLHPFSRRFLASMRSRLCT